MTGFLAAAALAVALTLLLLLRPFLWRKAAPAAATHRQLNAAIYRDQFAELENDRAEGTLIEEDYRQARAELQRRVLDDAQDETVALPQAPKKTLLALALLLPAGAAALYFLLGNPEGLAPQQHRVSSQEVENMVANLAARLEKEPDNFEGWLMLGRSYKAMRRFGEAEKAFDRAAPLLEKDAQLLAVYADVVAANAGGSFDGKPLALIEKALKVDPNNLQALWLAGSAAFAGGRFGQAVTTWERLLKLLPPESEDAKQLASGIAEARAQIRGDSGGARK